MNPGASNSSSSSTPVPLTVSGHDLLFPSLPYDMKGRAASAVNDSALVNAVQAATVYKDQNRKKSFAEVFGDRYDRLKDLAGRIKQHTLEHLDFYVDRFVENATAAGVQVHFARDAQEANAIAVHIARERSCRLCVKSKSMVTEETQLLPELEAIGCKTWETDLGEFILQLDHDAPSHIVTPMIHKNRQAVARAFVRELGVAYTEDPGELTQIARRYLRDMYRQADLGVSGGNFLIADTGSLVICTNEGNGRLCTSVPPVHIAFVGIEKMLPSVDHLAVFLKLLARSSTAQPMTVYTHVITGPKRSVDPDGPKEVHIILVDNGRTKVLADPEARSMLRCIRCGACLNACPVYRSVGGHAYGSVYSGPIGAILTPMMRGLAPYHDLPNASSLCGACYEACPVRIDIPSHLIRLRRELVKAKQPALAERMVYRLWAWSLSRSWSYRLGGWSQRLMLRQMGQAKKQRDGYVDQGWVEKGPGPLAGWTDQRDLPTPPSKSFRDWWNREHQQP